MSWPSRVHCENDKARNIKPQFGNGHVLQLKNHCLLQFLSNSKTLCCLKNVIRFRLRVILYGLKIKIHNKQLIFWTFSIRNVASLNCVDLLKCLIYISVDLYLRLPCPRANSYKTCEFLRRFLEILLILELLGFLLRSLNFVFDFLSKIAKILYDTLEISQSRCFKILTDIIAVKSLKI